MTDLDRECRVFCRYLVQREANTYVTQKYIDANAMLGPRMSATRMDAWLVKFAQPHPWCTRMADMYSRLLLPRSTLRSKLVILLAILESCAPTAARFYRTHNGNAALAFMLLILQCAASLLLTILAVVVLAPVHALARLEAQWFALHSARQPAAMDKA
jgi:hypothetical protein